jgi:hypothetical protein
MKRLFITLALLVPMMGMAQNNKQIDKLFRKYANREGITCLNLGYIPVKLSGFACKITGHSEEAELLKNINGISILAVDDKRLNESLNFYKELQADGFFRYNNYEMLMEVTEKDQVVRFYGRSGKNGTLSDLLLVVGGKDNTLISIRGSINPKDIGKISGSQDLGVHSSQTNIFAGN